MRPTHYYVWYRMTGEADAARAAVEGIFAAMAGSCGVHGRLLVRRDDPSTWMEIYEAVADAPAFERALAAEIERHAATSFAEGRARHTEAFVTPSA